MSMYEQRLHRPHHSSSCPKNSISVRRSGMRRQLPQQQLLLVLTTLVLLLGTASYQSRHGVRGVYADKNEPYRSYVSPPIIQQDEQQVPVIGILSQPSKKLDHSYHYIATSYVDWIEASGAITIPIPYDASPSLLDDIFTQINGVLLPGGWNGYMPPSVPYLLDKVMESNRQGNYFPVWGTCLGYEFLVKYIGGVDAIQSGFDLYNTSIPLESVRVRELYKEPSIYQTVTTLPVTLNNHQLGIEPSHFLQNKKLTSIWNITSINYDVNHRPFVSSIEPINPQLYPLYGVQYHPEKNAYEYTIYPNTDIPYENIDHTPEGIEFSLYMSNFFVNKVRYGQSTNVQQHVYNKRDIYPPIRSYPSNIGIKYEDIYIIPYASHWTYSMIHNNNHSNNRTIATAATSININGSTTTTTTTTTGVNDSNINTIRHNNKNKNSNNIQVMNGEMIVNNHNDDNDDMNIIVDDSKNQIFATATALLLSQS